MHARHPAAGRFAPPCLAPLVLALTALVASAQTHAAPAPAAAVEVRLPGDAELWFQGVKMAETGGRRTFTTPPLSPGLAYTYDVFARWHAEGKDVARRERFVVRAGDSLVVDFTRPVPGDLGPGHMAVRELKGGAPFAGAGPAAANGSLLEWSPRQPSPRRSVGYVSVADIDIAPGPGEPRLPNYVSVVEFDRPRR